MGAAHRNQAPAGQFGTKSNECRTLLLGTGYLAHELFDSDTISGSEPKKSWRDLPRESTHLSRFLQGFLGLQPGTGAYFLVANVCSKVHLPVRALPKAGRASLHDGSAIRIPKLAHALFWRKESHPTTVD